jgi:hypothetical protein
MTKSATPLALGFTAILAGASLAAGPAGAQALSAVGQVLQVRAPGPQDVVILRKSGVIQPARAYDWLMPGDRIQVRSAAATATLYDIGAHRSVRVSSVDGPKSVGGASPGGYTQAAADFFEGFNSLFSTPRRPIAVETQARGADATPPLLADQVLPTGEQSLPQGQTSVALIWHGAAADVALTQAGGHVVAQAPSSAYASATLATPPLNGTYTLAVAGQALSWRIATTAATAIPEPPWMSGASSTTEAERVVRAAWILRQGPVQWRLFAITELAALSDGDYAAGRLWQALQAGDFATAAAAAP